MKNQALLSMNTLFLKECRQLINSEHLDIELALFLKGLNHAIEYGNVTREMRDDFKTELVAGLYFKNKDQLRSYTGDTIKRITDTKYPRVIDFYEGLLVESVHDNVDSYLHNRNADITAGQYDTLIERLIDVHDTDTFVDTLHLSVNEMLGE